MHTNEDAVVILFDGESKGFTFFPADVDLAPGVDRLYFGLSLRNGGNLPAIIKDITAENGQPLPNPPFPFRPQAVADTDHLVLQLIDINDNTGTLPQSYSYKVTVEFDGTDYDSDPHVINQPPSP